MEEEIVSIISEWKRIKYNPTSERRRKQTPVGHGKKRVEAICKDRYGNLFTRHLDIPK